MAALYWNTISVCPSPHSTPIAIRRLVLHISVNAVLYPHSTLASRQFALYLNVSVSEGVHARQYTVTNLLMDLSSLATAAAPSGLSVTVSSRFVTILF
jgi:hypothetical protein